MTTSPHTACIHHYELTNHLGNVSVIVSDKKLLSANQSQQLYLPEVISYQDYYPFGMAMTDRSGSLPDAAYRYGYNGKENDNEVKGESNQQDYGFRVYDPRVGRFLSVDPLTNDYPMLTPYQFASNTPIESIDMDGAEYFSSKEAVFNITNGDIEVKQPVMEEIDPSWNNGNPYIFKVGNKKYLGFNNIFGSFNLSKSIFKLKEYLHFDGGYTYDVSTNPFRDWQLSQQNRPSNSYRIKNNGGLDRRYTAWGTRVNNTSTPSAIRSIAGPMAAYIFFDLFYTRYKSSIASDINENMMEQIQTIQKKVLVDVMMAASLNLIPKKYQTETFYSSIANILYSGENTSGNKDLEKIALEIGYNISYPPLAERALIISDNLMIGESDPMFKKLWNMNSKMTLKWKEQ